MKREDNEMASEDITISLEEFGKYFLKKWKIVALLVFLCTGIFCGATKILGEEISVPHSEEYLYYEQESAWLESYLEESVLMQMNPTDIPEITLYLENSSSSFFCFEVIGCFVLVSFPVIKM